VVDHAFRVEQPIAAAIEGPGAAERAVPRATAREFDRGAGVEHADEIFAAVAQEVACGADLFEALDEATPGALPVRGDGTGHLRDCARVAGDGFEQLDDARLALALEDAIDRALAVFYNRIRDERRTVAANTDETARQSKLRSLSYFPAQNCALGSSVN